MELQKANGIMPEIFRQFISGKFYGNPHYRVDKLQPLVSILCQLNPLLSVCLPIYGSTALCWTLAAFSDS
jgi:hypothetical protein